MAKAASSNSSEQHTQQGLKEMLLEKRGLCFSGGHRMKIVGIAFPEPWGQTRQTHSSTLLHYPLFLSCFCLPCLGARRPHPVHTQSAV